MPRSVAFTPHVRAAGRALAVASAIAIAIATLRPESGSATADHWCVACGDTGGTDLVLNVLLFLPLGIGAALAGARQWHAAGAIALSSVVIEILQLTIISGRDAVIGDVLANTVGGVLGVLLASELRALAAPAGRLALCLTAGWSALWLALQVVSSAALVPAPTSSPYYGQIAHDFPHLELFPGRVMSFTIDGVAIRDERLVDTDRVAAAIRSSAPVRATVVVDGPTRDVAEIVGVMDAEHRVITMIGERGTAMMFTVRTTAASMRLRPLQFLLDGAFDDSTRGSDGAEHSIDLVARWGPRVVDMRASHDGRSVVRTLPLAPEIGWTLFFPAQWFVNGSRLERIISALWCMLSLLPLSYWATFAIRASRSQRTRAVLMIALVIVLGAGVSAVPLLFGIATNSAFATIASVLGLIAGHALAVSCVTLASAKTNYLAAPDDAQTRGELTPDE
jgi:VanZ like protein